MEQLNQMFFNVKDSDLQDIPVDEKMLVVLDHKGTLKRILAVDERWPLLSLSSRYLPYPAVCGPGSPTDTNISDFLTSWRETAKVYCSELSELTIMPYDRFWCHALFRTDQLLQFLRSFLMHGTRSFDLVNMSKDDLALHSRISGLVFMCILTLCYSRRTKNEHISPKKHAAFLQRFIKLPLLFDFCALYGQEGIRDELLKKMLLICFREYRRLLTEVRNCVRDLGDSIFQLWEEKFFGSDDMSIPSLEGYPLEDVVLAVGYMCDITCSLQRFVRVVPENSEGVTAIRDAKLASRLVHLSNTVIWNINKEVCNRLKDAASHSAVEMDSLRKVQRQGMLVEFAAIDMFRRLEVPALNAARVTPQEMEKTLLILLEVSSQHKRFAILYEKWMPIRPDITRIKSVTKVDESVVDRLAHSVKQACLSENIQWDFFDSGKQQKAQQAPFEDVEAKNAPDSSKIQLATVKNAAEEEKLESAAREIMGFLVDVDIVYVKACLKHFNMDKDKTVDAILSGDVPLSLSEHVADVGETEPASETKEAAQPPKVMQKQSATVLPRPSTSSRTGVANPGTFIQKVYYGKRDAYEEIEEGEVPDETKAITIAMAKVYDDEYDDTYDDIEADEVMRLNERIDLVQNELKKMGKDRDSSEEVSEDETAPAKPVTPRTHGPQQQFSHNNMRGRGNYRGGVGHGRPPRGKGNDPRVQHVAKQTEPVSGNMEQSREPERPAKPNDPWAAQMAQNFEVQTSRRNAGPRSSNTQPSATEQQAHKNKEQNKAHVGNHNRKGRGQWKRSQGMF